VASHRSTQGRLWRGSGLPYKLISVVSYCSFYYRIGKVISKSALNKLTIKMMMNERKGRRLR
jgi:hypothetical protein